MQVLRNVGMLRLRDGSLTVKFEDHGDYVPAPLLLETSLGMPAPDQDQAGPQVYQKGSQFVFRGLAHYGALATVQQCNTETTPGTCRSRMQVYCNLMCIERNAIAFETS